MPSVAELTLTEEVSIEEIYMAGAYFLAGQTVRVTYSVKTNAGAYADATSTTIAVRDSSGSTRVVYASANLTKTATGKYRYTFTIPETVIEGDWRVNIQATISGSVGARNHHFEVRGN